MENRFKLFLIIFLTIGLGALVSCSGDFWDWWNKNMSGSGNPIPVYSDTYVTTLKATNITNSTATLNAEVITYDKDQSVEFGYYEIDSTGYKITLELRTTPIQVYPLDSLLYVSADITGLSEGATYLYYINVITTPTPIRGDKEAFATNPPSDKYFGGGIKFYVDSTGQHGLIASTNDQSIGEIWIYCSDYPNCISVNGTGTSIGTGQANTTAIVKAYSSGNSAAKLCDNLVLNGYSDWFLPSKDELNLLYTKRAIVGGFNPDAYYWSSSESSAFLAWAQSFSIYGTKEQIVKNNEYVNVRAIRAY